MAARAEGAWHAQGHCALGGGRGHQRSGRVRPPHTATAPHRACGLVLPGRLGCRRPLMPVLPVSFERQSTLLAQLTSQHCRGPMEAGIHGPARPGLQEDVTPAKGPASCRWPAREQVQAASQSGALPGKWGHPICLEGTGAAGTLPTVSPPQVHPHRRRLRHPLPSFPLPVGRNAPPYPCCARRASWRRSEFPLGQGRCVFLWAAGPGREVKTSWRGGRAGGGLGGWVRGGGAGMRGLRLPACVAR